MRKDDLGAPVAALQRQLKALGHTLEITSVFDAATEAAVIAFQRLFQICDLLFIAIGLFFLHLDLFLGLDLLFAQREDPFEL